MHSDIFTVETYSFGISGFDTQILTFIRPDVGVLMAPMDPWFMFSPVSLPSLSTEWVRQYNLVPARIHWMYWLPFDPPYDVFEWAPKWAPAIKRYVPLTAMSYPVKVPLRNIPSWVFHAQQLCRQYYLDEMDEAFQPPREVLRLKN